MWAALTAVVHTQQPRSSCPPEGWSHARLETLKKEQFLVADPSARQELALARTDRIDSWMSGAERDNVVRAAASYLAGIRDYRAFDDKDGFRHGVAHGADLVLQLTLNPTITKSQLDQMLLALASQVSPDANIAYWAGEPERLARPVLFAAQRKLHTADEWSSFFREITNPKPLESWKVAFSSELGIRKRHNVRAFLLSVYANAISSDDPGVRQLAAHATAELKAVP